MRPDDVQDPHKKNGQIAAACPHQQCAECNGYQVCCFSEQRCKITTQTLFPGIVLSYNDYHTGACRCNFHYEEPAIIIDHCLEGRIEWEHEDGTFCYLGERDVQISTKADHINMTGFPTNRYYGITIHFLMAQAKESLNRYFSAFHIDLDQIWEKYCTQKDYILRADSKIQHFFDVFYHEQDQDYRSVKVVELLLYLLNSSPSDAVCNMPYFQKGHVEKVRMIKDYICQNTDQRITLKELSHNYEIPLDTLKACFKSMYGQSVYAFSKHYRLDKAAELLRETDQSIIDIALEVGYSSPSKFTEAFKNHINMTPLKYRKINH